MASSASDSVIFLYLGLNLVRLDHIWHTGLIVATILLTLLVRFAVIYGLSALVNTSRLRQISSREMFIMAYGGLRGAVAFSLVSLIDHVDQKTRSMFMTTTLVIVIFTVFIQGGTIKPLVALLDIRRQNKQGQLMLFDELHCNVTDHLMAGIEEIVGKHGQFFFYDWLIHLDDKYVKHRLQRNPVRKDEKIMQLYEKIALKQHFAHLKGTEAAEKFIKQSVSMLDDTTLPCENMGSQASLQRQLSGGRPTRPSLLSQLTRYGTLDDPEQIDDLAYIMPEMLEDEAPTARSRKRYKRQQTAIAQSLHDAKHLKNVLSQPGANMPARALVSNMDMDDRSDLMHLLQEKSKRLERFQRSTSQMGQNFSMNPAGRCFSCDADYGRSIVKKSGMGKQNSLLDAEKQNRLKDLHDMSNVEEGATPDTNQNKDKNNSNTSGEPVQKKSNRGEKTPGKESLSPGELELLELQPRERMNTLDTVLGLLASKSDQDLKNRNRDVERGEGNEKRSKSAPPVPDDPIAHSSQESAWKFNLPPLAEGTEDHSSPEQNTGHDASGASNSDVEEDADPENVALVPKTKPNNPDVNT